MDDHDREALATETREEYDEYFRILNRRFGRRWWTLQWERLAAPYWAVRHKLLDRADAPVKVDAVLLARATQTLAACAELEQVDEEVGGSSVKASAEQLNQYLPEELQVDLS